MEVETRNKITACSMGNAVERRAFYCQKKRLVIHWFTYRKSRVCTRARVLKPYQLLTKIYFHITPHPPPHSCLLFSFFRFLMTFLISSEERYNFCPFNSTSFNRPNNLSIPITASLSLIQIFSSEFCSHTQQGFVLRFGWQTTFHTHIISNK